MGDGAKMRAIQDQARIRAAAMWRLREAGMTLADVGRAFGTDRGNVRRILAWYERRGRRDADSRGRAAWEAMVADARPDRRLVASRYDPAAIRVRLKPGMTLPEVVDALAAAFPEPPTPG